MNRKLFIIGTALVMVAPLPASAVYYPPSQNSQQTPAAKILPTPVLSPTLAPTPAPTPTATLTPDVIAGTAPAKPGLSPVMIFLIGALVGGALLSLSEVSALSYLKKHPGKK